MEAIPLDDGDPRWVFPELGDTGPEPVAVRSLLAQSAANMRRLAGHLGVRAGVTGAGLEYQRDGPDRSFGASGVFAWVATPGVVFKAALYYPLRRACQTEYGPPWTVETEVLVMCPAEEDCYGHAAAQTKCSEDSALAAVRALADATALLLDHALRTPLTAWRELTVESCHSAARSQSRAAAASAVAGTGTATGTPGTGPEPVVNPGRKSRRRPAPRRHHS
jgi:hypothetical protein